MKRLLSRFRSQQFFLCKICGEAAPKIEICMETPCWCPSGWALTWFWGDFSLITVIWLASDHQVKLTNKKRRYKKLTEIKYTPVFKHTFKMLQSFYSPRLVSHLLTKATFFIPGTTKFPAPTRQIANFPPPRKPFVSNSLLSLARTIGKYLWVKLPFFPRGGGRGRVD